MLKNYIQCCSRGDGLIWIPSLFFKSERSYFIFYLRQDGRVWGGNNFTNILIYCKIVNNRLFSTWNWIYTSYVIFKHKSNVTTIYIIIIKKLFNHIFLSLYLFKSTFHQISKVITNLIEFIRLSLIKIKLLSLQNSFWNRKLVIWTWFVTLKENCFLVQSIPVLIN